MRIDPIIQQELEIVKRKGFPVKIEDGSKHMLLYINEKFVSVLGRHNKDDPRMAKNTRARIRRFLKGI